MKKIKITKWFFYALCFIFVQSAGFAETELGPILQFAGLPKKGDYKINIVKRSLPSESFEELKKREPALTPESFIFKYTVYVHDNNLFLIRLHGFSFMECEIAVNMFYDGGPFMYHFDIGTGDILCLDKKKPIHQISYNLPYFLNYIDKELDLQSSAIKVKSIKSRLKNGLAIKENYTYLLPEKDGFLFKLRFHKTKSNRYIVEYAFEVHDKAEVSTLKIRYEIEPLKKPIPLELFTPNGFGDKKLVQIVNNKSQVRLFVRDFLPTPEKIKELFASKEARAEYEAEAKNRPRVGLIDKYLKKIKLESE